MKIAKFRSRLKEDITENYNICQMLLGQAGRIGPASDPIKYEQLMYLLFNGRIPIKKIAYFRSKKYKNEEPLMRKSFIIEDALKINEEIVSKAWKYERPGRIDLARSLSVNQSKEVEYKLFKKYQTLDIHKNEDITINISNAKEKILQELKQTIQEIPEPQQLKSPLQKEHHKIWQSQKQIQNTPNKKQQHLKMRHKILDLEQFLVNIQSKMNLARNENQAAQYQKQYNKVLKQLNSVKNRKRIENENNLLRKVQIQTSANISQRIFDILHRMNEIKTVTAKKLSKSPIYTQKISKFQQISRMNSIFNYYAIKQTKNTNRYFSDLQKQQSKLSLQTFLKFSKQFHLNRIITLQQIIHIFKTRSKGNRFIDILQFSQITSDIHNYQCIKQEKEITNQSISQYIQQYIVCDKKMNKIMMNGEENYEEEAKKNQRYEFKPHSHSGKYLYDIKEELQTRKQAVEHLAGPQNIIKFKNKSKNKTILLNSSKTASINNNTSKIGTSSRIQTQNSLENKSLNQHSHKFSNNNSMIEDNSNLNSYAFRFKLKNTKSRIKTQGIIRSITNTQDSNSQSLNMESIRNRTNGINNNLIFFNEQSRQNTISPNKNSNTSNKPVQQQQNQEQNVLITNILNKKNVVKGKNEPFEGFQNLIEESEQDQYLNMHLLPPIQNKKYNIHF